MHIMTSRWPLPIGQEVDPRESNRGIRGYQGETQQPFLVIAEVTYQEWLDYWTQHLADMGLGPIPQWEILEAQRIGRFYRIHTD